MSNKVLFIVAPTQYLPSGGIQTQIKRTQVKLEKFTKGVLKADLNHLKQEDGILGTNDGSL